MRSLLLSTLTFLLFLPQTTEAQQTSISDTSMLQKKVQMPYKIRRLYTGKAYDFAILSSSLLSVPGEDNKLTVPRFTLFANGGINLHYDMSRYFGIYSGIHLKNIGFIEKVEDVTIKRRVYSLGVPLGIKIGDLRNRNFFFLGGGVDLPVNYREKVFVKRGDKEKFNEWFSKRTPRLMPFVFIGNSWDPGITLKLQYYPLNFMNEDFVDDESMTVPPMPVKPYQGYKVNLFLVSLGIDIHYAQYKVQEREYQEWRKARMQERNAQQP